MQICKLLRLGFIAIISVALVPAVGIAEYTVLWDISHGVAGQVGGSLGWQPDGGYFQVLDDHLLANGFNVSTVNGFTDDNLAGADVAVVCLPSAFDTEYSDDEAVRLSNFVSAGGGLLILGDRGNNGTIQLVASGFGIAMGVADLSPFELYTSDLDLSHSIFEGFGPDDEIFMYAGSALSANGPDILEVGFQEGTANALVAAGEFGLGRVVALGDSSIWAETNPSDPTFDMVNNRLFSVNTFEYLAVPEPGTLLVLGLGIPIVSRSRRKR